MKNNILRISIVPVLAFIMLTVNDLQQKGKEKENKGNQEQKDKDQGKGNESKDHGRSDDHSSNAQQGNNGRDNDKNNGKGNDNDRRADIEKKSGNGRNDDKNNNGKNDDRDENQGRGHREVVRWAHDPNINWNLNDFPNRKRPKDFKKVAVCHQTGNEFPVTINISENALQAHLNHGDQAGACTINYSDRFPKNYIVARENVYNVYENSWERVSFGEALLQVALNKLLGLKTDLNQYRVQLAPAEVQRREMLILELQDNTNALQNQLNLSRQQLDNVNIYINL